MTDALHGTSGVHVRAHGYDTWARGRGSGRHDTYCFISADTVLTVAEMVAETVAEGFLTLG